MGFSKEIGLLKRGFYDTLKLMELAKAYNPTEHEKEINRLWTESGFFNPDNLKLPSDAPAYTIVLPPPNVTDRLHLGHASMLAIQDLLIRFHRMNGYRALWIPGTDHAAIATQAVVERKLYQEEKKTRHDLGREAFVKKVTDFALENQTTIINQFKEFGASLDWSRLAFTLDEPRQKAVRQMFVDMYEAGIIYRGERIVNWCPHCYTTLADDEVKYKTEKTTLYTFKYWSDFPIEISSTRPETKLGDTAVAVNPKDERYQQYIGQEFTGSFCGQSLTIKIIADREVDQTFGSGALGVTPAHSMIDWRMAEEHQLPIIKVINEDGKIRDGFGVYTNLSVSEARQAIIESLRAAHLISKEEEIEHNVSVCSRCDTPVEPLPSLQWFVAVDKPVEKLGGLSLKAKALAVSEDSSITFTPTRFKKRYEDWMKNLRDWCISRQILFGHQIPVWYRGEGTYVGTEAPQEEGWLQDSDTLDTWFSSGMWTFSTLGWPETYQQGKKTGDLAQFHPTDMLETGYDIITLWISRMIMMSLFALQEIPFKNVYLHGMVLDKDGKKMSKSKGNGIDFIAMAKLYGTDAVRLSLLLGNTPGVDVRLSEEKIASFRNLINKLWNISRYIMSKEGEKDRDKTLSLADQWIMSRLSQTVTEVTEKIKAFDFSGAGETLRAFTVDDFADWYIEASKFQTGDLSVAKQVLETILKLWHPFIPFVTETIWQTFKPQASLLLVTEWPQNLAEVKSEHITAFSLIQRVIVAIRNIRSEHKIDPTQKLATCIYTSHPEYLKVLQAAAHLISSLRTGVGELVIAENGEVPAQALYSAIDGIDIYVESAVDTTVEKARLEKELTMINELVERKEKMLANEEFVSHAKPEIVEKERTALADYKVKIEKIREQLESFNQK